MRVWIDITAPAHVLVFRPLLPLLRERGAEVEITARDYAQTVQLLELHGIEADAPRPARRALAAREGALADLAAPRPAALGQAAGSSTSRSRTGRTS